MNFRGFENYIWICGFEWLFFKQKLGYLWGVSPRGLSFPRFLPKGGVFCLVSGTLSKHVRQPPPQ